MVYEDDTLEIPEEYKRMSIEELEEAERIYKTLERKNTGELQRKLESCPIKFKGYC